MVGYSFLLKYTMEDTSCQILLSIFLKACFLKYFAQILILNLDFESYNQSNDKGCSESI